MLTPISLSPLFSYRPRFSSSFYRTHTHMRHFSPPRPPYAPNFLHHGVFRERDPLHSTKNHHPRPRADELETIIVIPYTSDECTRCILVVWLALIGLTIPNLASLLFRLHHCFHMMATFLIFLQNSYPPAPTFPHHACHTRQLFLTTEFSEHATPFTQQKITVHTSAQTSSNL